MQRYIIRRLIVALPVRNVDWVGQAVQGNLGYRMSKADPRPVSVVLADRIPRTIELMFAAIIIAQVIGVVLGVISALKQYSVVDYILTVFAFLGVATPSFFLALGLIVIF